jgi:hypothetical protein
MTPAWLIEGRQETRTASGAEGRLRALAAAIREHEAITRQQSFSQRPRDEALYRHLRQICGET